MSSESNPFIKIRKCTVIVEWRDNSNRPPIEQRGSGVDVVVQLHASSASDRPVLCVRLPGNPICMRLDKSKYKIYNRFLNEGKLTIRIGAEAGPQIFVYVSRAAVEELEACITFLREFRSLIKQAKQQARTATTTSIKRKSPSSSLTAHAAVYDGALKKSRAESCPSSVSVSSPLSAEALKRLKRSIARIMVENEFSEGQLRVLEACAAGQNVFMSGAAGTGKSFLLSQVLRALPKERTAVTATTGAAACGLQGVTIHYWSGLGSGDKDVSSYVRRIRSKPDVMRRWKHTDTLIIDEISMMDAAFFTKLDKAGRIIRQRNVPFGGLQVIVSGDFAQLPPVANAGETARYCFESPSWAKAMNVQVSLTKIFRQKGDQTLIELLNGLRTGVCTAEMEELIRSRASAPLPPALTEPVQLRARRADVERINSERLSALPGKEVAFRCRDLGHGMAMKQLSNSCTAAETVRLKVGARVMLLRNIDIESGLHNGAIGEVVRFEGTMQYPVVRFKTRDGGLQVEQTIKTAEFIMQLGSQVVARRIQIPLALGWATTIHQSQGQTLDAVEIDLRGVFEVGQTYVALSRVRSFEGLRILGFKRSHVRASEKVIEFYDAIQ